jgi:hypothetical protein
MSNCPPPRSRRRGAPPDVTVSELSIEWFFAAHAGTGEYLRRMRPSDGRIGDGSIRTPTT